MPRAIKIAAVQMDANPAPTGERLVRAEKLVTQAAQAGAQLVVLPELFNTGYAYAAANHALAEPLDGSTAAWMRETAARLNIHLAGSLMLLDQDEVYNALLLFSPAGRRWRYDKNYPWGWERGYFKDASRITVAQTDLGDLGMLICWDAAHPHLWKRYAGRVDMMLICSCPPDVSNPTFCFPNGDQVTFDDMGPVTALLKGDAQRVFGDMIDQQIAWLGVPAVNIVGSGRIQTAIPNGRASLLCFLPAAPWLVKYLPQANQMQMACDLIAECKIVDANGRALTKLSGEQGETFTIANVTLADEKPSPRAPQPKALASWLTYLLSDTLLPQIVIPVYRRGLRCTWGPQMAPVGSSTRRWIPLLGLSVVAVFVAWARHCPGT